MITVSLFGITIFIEYASLILLMLGFCISCFYIKARGCGGEGGLVLWSFVVALLMIASLFAHEAGHAVAAYISGIKINFFGVSWWGAYTNLSVRHQDLLPQKDLFISAAGPLVNIGLGVWMALMTQKQRKSAGSGVIQFIRDYNIYTGLLNLVPLGITDGRWILSDLLEILKKF